jgi:hypothetical protein
LAFFFSENGNPALCKFHPEVQNPFGRGVDAKREPEGAALLFAADPMQAAIHVRNIAFCRHAYITNLQRASS